MDGLYNLGNTHVVFTAQFYTWKMTMIALIKSKGDKFRGKNSIRISWEYKYLHLDIISSQTKKYSLKNNMCYIIKRKKTADYWHWKRKRNSRIHTDISFIHQDMHGAAHLSTRFGRCDYHLTTAWQLHVIALL